MCHAVDQSGGPDGFWANMCKYGSFSRLTQDFLTKENIFKDSRYTLDLPKIYNIPFNFYDSLFWESLKNLQ